MPCSHSIKLNMLQCSSNLQHDYESAGKGQTCAEPVRPNISGSGKRKLFRTFYIFYVRLSAQFHAAVSAKPQDHAKPYFQLAFGVVKGENTVMDGSFEMAEPFVAL